MEYSSTISGAPTEYYNNSNPEGKARAKWWNEEKGSFYKHVWPLYKKLRTHQNFRSVNNLRYARLYANMNLLGLKAGQYTKVTEPQNYLSSRVTYNVIKSCIDSATAKIGARKPRPVYLTDNGTWLMQQKAKRLNQFVLGMFEQIGTGKGEDRTMWGLGRQSFRDGCVFGTGVTYFSIRGDKVIAERNLCEELIVDETEGMYRNPRQMHRHRYMNREQLLDLYGSDKKIAEKIIAAPGVDETREVYETTADMVETLESWHLPSGPEAKDGRHVISIESCDLMSEEYEDDFFPFLIQRWSPRILGFYGMGLAEELAGIQLEINKLLRNIQISQHLMAVPQIWLEYQSRTVKKKINNAIGGIKYYLGRPPIAMVPQAMSGEVYQHLERLYQRAYEISGISLLSATSKKPAGLDSGVALREYKDTETERFAIQEAAYDDYFVEAAEMIRKLCRKMAKQGKNPIVQWKDGSSMKTIKFSDVDVPDNKVVVTARPSNLLPKEPAGLLAKVQELTQAGIYTQEEALELLDFPDVAKVNKVKLGPRNVVIKIVESMVEENKYMTPEPYMNLEFARQYAQDYYANGKADGMPEERLELLRRFMNQCDSLIMKRDQQMAAGQQQAMMQAQGPEAVPTGVPEQQPTSDLLSNVPQQAV